MAELLLLGQVDDAAQPAAAAAEVYLWSKGFGNSAIILKPGLVESPDVAPLGPLGRLIARQVTEVIGFDAGLTIRITVIADLNTEVASKTVQFTTPLVYTRRAIVLPFAAVLTYVRVRIEVLSCVGPVDLFTPQLGVRPVAQASRIADRAAV